MNPRSPTFTPRFWLFLGSALVLLKLWLVAGVTVYGIGAAGHDDALYVRLASAVLRGNWLGDYNQMTLAKGPMYPLWIAGVFLTGLPLLTAQHLLYAAMCALLVLALRPVIAAVWLRFALFAVLLFNPMTYETVIHSRVIRLGIYPAAVLGILAGLIALHTRRKEPICRLAGWALLLGLSLPFFWLTREEGIWILPFALPLWTYTLWTIWCEEGGRALPKMAFLLSPALLWAGGILLVCQLNNHYYGVAATVEFKVRAFQDAYGALTRVQPAHPKPFVPVTKEARALIYAVSPAFAELRPQLEGALGEAWATPSALLTHEPASNREIAGGWFMWALRDSVAPGHCKSGADAMAFYEKLAREVNDACDRGRLPAGPRRSGFAPPLGEILTPLVARKVLAAGKFFVTLDGFASYPVTSHGPAELLIPFADLSRERLTPMSGAAPIPPFQRWLDRVRLRQLNNIAAVYLKVIKPAALLAALAWLVATGLSLWHRRLPFLFVLNAGLLAAAAVMTAINGIIDALSFPSIATGAFTACYPLYFLFLCTAPLQLIEAWHLNHARVIS